MIDLRSDTVTRPVEGMREAMYRAEVGDDVFGEDPTITQLQSIVAELLGKEAALFVPSGVMANQLGVLVHTQPGTEVILERRSHIFNYEGGSPAWLAGVQLCPIDGEKGILDPQTVHNSIRFGKYGQPATRLICLENTHNLAGGIAQTTEQLSVITDIAQTYSLPTHLDGARLWNASIALNTAISDFAALFNTVSVCLSKGLGAPIGSLLCGSKQSIDKARSFRKRLGGGMRQVGILGAAGLYAIEHHIERLAEDHRNAKKLALALSELPYFTVNLDDVQTNIVYFDVASPLTVQSVIEELEKEGIYLIPTGPNTIRAVTHLDVSPQEIDHTIEVLQHIFGPHAVAT